MAGTLAAHDASTSALDVDSQHLHADVGRPTLLRARTCHAAGRRVQLISISKEEPRAVVPGALVGVQCRSVEELVPRPIDKDVGAGEPEPVAAQPAGERINAAVVEDGAVIQ